MVVQECNGSWNSIHRQHLVRNPVRSCWRVATVIAVCPTLEGVLCITCIAVTTVRDSQLTRNWRFGHNDPLKPRQVVSRSIAHHSGARLGFAVVEPNQTNIHMMFAEQRMPANLAGTVCNSESLCILFIFHIINEIGSFIKNGIASPLKSLRTRHLFKGESTHNQSLVFRTKIRNRQPIKCETRKLDCVFSFEYHPMSA